MRFYEYDGEVFRRPDDGGSPTERWIGSDRWTRCTGIYELSEEEFQKMREVTQDEAIKLVGS